MWQWGRVSWRAVKTQLAGRRCLGDGLVSLENKRWFSVSWKQELEHSGKGNLEMSKRVWLGTEEASQEMVMALRLPETQECLITSQAWSGIVCAGPGLHDSCGSLLTHNILWLWFFRECRGLDVQGLGDGAHVSFDVFGISFVYFSVSVSLLTTWITLRHKNWTQDLGKTCQATKTWKRQQITLLTSCYWKLKRVDSKLFFCLKVQLLDSLDWESLLLLLSLLNFC